MRVSFRSRLVGFALHVLLALCTVSGAAAQSGGLSADAAYSESVRKQLLASVARENGRDFLNAEASLRLAVDIAELQEPRDLPLALLWQAGFLRRHKRLPEARATAKRALDLFLGTLGPDHLSTAVAYSALGSMDIDARDFAAAEPRLRAVLDAYGRDPRKEREVEVWISAWNLAMAYQAQRRFAEVDQPLKLALEIKGRLQPREAKWMAIMGKSLATNHAAQGDVERAAALYDRAVAEAETLEGADVTFLAAILTEQAQMQQRWGRQEASLRTAERALAAHQRVPQRDQTSIAMLRSVLGNAALARGQRGEADEHYAAILDSYAREPAPGRTAYAAAAAGQLALSHRIARRYGEAMVLARRAIDLRLQQQPFDRLEVARAQFVLGSALFAQNSVTEGAAEMQIGLDLFEAIGRQTEELASAYQLLGVAYFDAGRYRESERPLRKALEMASAWGPSVVLSDIQLSLSMSCRYLDRHPEAEALARQSLDLRRRKLAEDDPRIGDAIFQLAAALYWQRRYSEAEPLLRQALAIHLKAYGTDHLLVLSDTYSLALNIQELGRVAEAEILLRETAVAQEKVLGPRHERVADTLVSLVRNLRRQARYEEAAQIAERPLAIYRETMGADHPRVLQALLPLAAIRQERGEFDEAERLLKDALRINLLAYGADDLNVAQVYGELAGLAAARRQFAEGVGYAEKTLSIVEATLGADDLRIIPILAAAANFRVLSGDLEGPEALFKRALSIAERHYGVDSVQAGYASLNLAYIYRLRGRFGDVAAYYEKPLAIFEAHLGPRHPAVGLALLWGAQFEIAIGQAKEAEASYDRALAIYSAAYGENSPARATVLVNKALLLIQLNRTGEAEKLLKESIELLRKAAGRETPTLACALVNLALLYVQLDREPEAEQLMKQAVAMYGRLYGPDRAPPIIMSPVLGPPPRDI